MNVKRGAFITGSLASGVSTVLVIPGIASESHGSAAADSRLSRLHVCTELFAGNAAGPPLTKAAAPFACRVFKDELSVRFLEGDPIVQEKVRHFAERWNQYSGVHFVF